MAPSTRIIFALMATTATAVFLCAALVFGGLDRLGLRSSEANIDFLLGQLRGSIEANVGLGLPLANIRVVQNLVERAKATDERVLAVEVFSPTGVSLFNTDRGSIGENIPVAWRGAIRNRVVGDRWRVEELGDIVVGEVMRNDFGEPVGYLAVTLSGEARNRHAEGLLVALSARLAIVSPFILIAALLVAVFMFDRTTRDIRNLAQRLLGRPTPAGAAAFAGVAQGVRATVDRAVLDFERAADDVMKTDEA